MNKILVLGGTGFVGRSVCEKLVERAGGAGLVRVPTRRLQHGQRLRALPTLELVQADVFDPVQLQALVTGIDAVVHLVAVLHGSPEQFGRVHVGLPRALAMACKTAGVRRLVHISALGVGPAATSNYLRSKTAGEAALAAGGSELTVLRPSVIFGTEDRFMNVFAQLQGLAPFIPLAGSAARFQPVWVEDVAQAVVTCLDKPDSIGKTYECAGPSEYTLSQLVHLAGQWSGHDRPQIALPEWAARLQAGVMEMLPGEPLMSRDNVASMRTPNVASGKLPGLAQLGINATALEAVAPAYLGAAFGRARMQRWRAGAGRN